MNKVDMNGMAATQSMNGINGTIRASAGTKQLGGSAFVSGQQGKLSFSANVMTSYNKPGNTTTEMEQLQDNMSYMQDFQPLNDEEQAIIAQATQIISDSIAVPCTACHYCTDGCPQQIAIPEYFNVYNTLQQFPGQTNSKLYYDLVSKNHGKASECIECGQCEAQCPQHIDIIDNLKLVAQAFEQS